MKRLLQCGNIFSNLICILLCRIKITLCGTCIIGCHRPQNIFSHKLYIFTDFHLQCAVCICFLVKLISIHIHHYNGNKRNNHSNSKRYNDCSKCILQLHSYLQFSVKLFHFFSSFHFLCSFLYSALKYYFYHTPFSLPLQCFCRKYANFIFFHTQKFPPGLSPLHSNKMMVQ